MTLISLTVLQKEALNEARSGQVQVADHSVAQGDSGEASVATSKLARLVAGWLRTFDLAAKAPAPVPDQPSPVAMDVALFVAFVSAMFGAALAISRHLPLFILEF